jgi:hypothetical protein
MSLSPIVVVPLEMAEDVAQHAVAILLADLCARKILYERVVRS